jgi:hypothetical protein
MVSSVFGRTGNVVAQEGDYTLTQLGDVTITSPTNNQVLKYNGTQWVNGTDTDTGLTSVGLSMPSAFSVANSPLTANGTLSVTGAGTTAQYVRGDGSLATFPTIAQEAQRLITEVYNSTGATLTKGTVVYINGGQGNLPTVTKAIATGDATSAQTYGVVQSDITNMNNGFVVAMGSLTNLDTQIYPVGTQLYLSATTAGAWTSVKQYAPNHLVYVGIVVRSHPTQGVVEIRIQNGYELDELHDVSAQSPTNGDILQYVAATDLWTKAAGTTTNIAEGTNLYFTDARARNAITLTTTGTSGAATYSGATLNIPQYQGVLTNPVTGTGTSGQVAYFNGTSSITSNAAFAFTPTSQLLVNNSVTAASAIARGTNLTPTLTAAANSDVLVGLDITPTFTNGAFTGVGNFPLRVNATNVGGNAFIRFATSSSINDFTLASTNQFAFTNRTSTTSLGSTSAAAWGLWDGTRINGLFGHGGTNANIGFSIGGAQVGAWFATGNLFVGSSPTDAGFRLDVNGTARVQGNITSFTSSSLFSTLTDSGLSFSRTSTSTLDAGISVPTGLNSARQILMMGGREGAQMTYNSFGRVQVHQTTTTIGLGTSANTNLANNTGTILTITGTKTASSSYASGIYTNTTLVAAANNDALIGLDINPTFTNGAFTGVSNTALRVRGNSAFNSQNTITVPSPLFANNTFLFVGNGALITASNRTIDNDLYLSSNLYYNGTNSIYRTTSAGATIGLDATGGVLIQTAVSGTAGAIASPTQRLYLFNSTGNLLLQSGGTFTDAGFRLDVNGTARVQSSFEVSAGATTINATSGIINLQKNGTSFLQINNDSFGVRLTPNGQVTVSTSLGMTLGNSLYDLNNNYSGYRGLNIRGGWGLHCANTPVASAIIQADSTTQGFLPPRMTAAQRAAISSPATGLMVYQTDGTEGVYVYSGGAWKSLTMV